MSGKLDELNLLLLVDRNARPHAFKFLECRGSSIMVVTAVVVKMNK